MKLTNATKQLLLRLLAGVAASLVLVGGLSRIKTPAPEVSRNGSSTEGLFYQVSALHPDGVIMTVDGEAVTVEEYLYWLYYYCDYNRTYLGYLGISDLDAEISQETTALAYIAQQAQMQALSMVTQNAVIRDWAAEAGITLTEEDLAGVESQRQSLVENSGGQEAYQHWLARMGVDDPFITQTLSAGYLIDHLYAAYCDPAGSLRPDDAQLRDYAADRGMVCAEVAMLSGAQDDDALAQLRLEAEDYASRISEAEDTSAAFHEVSELLGQYPEPALYSSDDYAALCAALLPLEEGAFSGVVDDGEGIFYLAIRTPLELELVAGSLLVEDFEARLLSAEVVYNDELYETVDVASFYEGMLIAQEALEPEDTPAG